MFKNNNTGKNSKGGSLPLAASRPKRPVFRCPLGAVNDTVENQNRVNRFEQKVRKGGPVRLVLLVGLLFSLAQLSFGDEIYRKNAKGNEYYKQGKYDSAYAEYDGALLTAPGDTLLRMNKGSALYHMGRFDEAESTYAGAVALKNKRKQADAHYNLGNILFKEGDQLMQSGGQGADEKYKAALQHYISALDLKPNDRDAKFNLELTQRRIKMQQQQQKNQNQNKQDQNKKDQNKQDQNKKDQNQQDQNKQDQNKKDQNKNDQNKDQDKKNQNQDQNKQDQNRNAQNDRQPAPNENKEDMKKQEAKRIIAQYADDADSLNKPPKRKAGLMTRKPEKDW
jgi:hypothetical protein